MPETLVTVTLPELGESVAEGSVVEWRVKPGEWVEEGATLVDVTTDKVDVEIPAPAAGIVRRIAAEAGATVAVGALLAEIDTAAPKPEGAGKPAAAPAAELPSATPVAAASARNGAAATGPNGMAGVAGRPSAAPAASHRAQRLAARANLDVGAIAGSGPGGLILG
ncbi:MAG: biotin/lipoyl-containing protein, partial [Vulcanimicrobiaceae bacterium]